MRFLRPLPTPAAVVEIIELLLLLLLAVPLASSTLSPPSSIPLLLLLAVPLAKPCRVDR